MLILFYAAQCPGLRILQTCVDMIFCTFATTPNTLEMDLHTKEEKLRAFGRLLDVLDELREKCPWDRKQTNESLRPNTIEEVYELSDALEQEDIKDTCKELGDVLLHVCFYAKIASEKEQFDIADVCTKLVDKLIFRHPHIYGDVKAGTAGEVENNWEKIKQKEKGRQRNRTVRCATCTPLANQSVEDTGENLTRRLRLGAQGRGVEQGTRRTFGIRRDHATWHQLRQGRRVRRPAIFARQRRKAVRHKSRQCA